MRLTALPPLALCVVLFACKGREQQQTPADSMNVTPADTTTSGGGVGAVGIPADSSAARDSAMSKTTTPRSARKTTRTPTTSPATPEKRKSQTTDSEPPRKFKKPEIRPVYPPIDRRRTDTSRTDTTAGRDTTVRP